MYVLVELFVHWLVDWLDFCFLLAAKTRMSLWLYCYACPHHVIKENAVLVVFHKHGFNETCHRMSLANEANRLLKPFLIIYLGNDNRNINVTPRIGRAFRVGAI